MMNNKIRVRLRGGIPTLAAKIECAEKAFHQLGWKVSRVYLSDTVWICGTENAEKRIAVYRDAGLDEKYISITMIQEHPAFFRTMVSNFGMEENTAQELLILSLWKDKKTTGGYQRVEYSGIPMMGEEGAVICDVGLWGDYTFIDVTVTEGYGRRTAWRIAEKFACETGMTVDRRMSKSRRQIYR